MNSSYKVYEISVRPEYDAHANVVTVIRWGVVYSSDGFESAAFIDTALALGELSNFTPIEQLQKEQIIAWCIAAQGGQPFLDRLSEYHGMQIEDQKRRANTAVYDGPLAFPLDVLHGSGEPGASSATIRIDRVVV
jgi:hypothetical protein